MKKQNSLLATIKQKRESIERAASKNGKVITLPRLQTPEMRMFIRDNTRGMVSATYSAEAVRNGYHASRKRYCFQRGETVLTAKEICRMASATEYNYAKFYKVLRERLGRELAPSEVQEILARAIKGHATETIAFTRMEIPKGVKVYAK